MGIEKSRDDGCLAAARLSWWFRRLKIEYGVDDRDYYCFIYDSMPRGRFRVVS